MTGGNLTGHRDTAYLLGDTRGALGAITKSLIQEMLASPNRLGTQVQTSNENG